MAQRKAKIELYCGEYRWRMTAANGRKLANCGEGFKTTAGQWSNLRAVARAFGMTLSSAARPRPGGRTDSSWAYIVNHNR